MKQPSAEELKPCPKCGQKVIQRHVAEYDKPSMNDHWHFGCICGLSFIAFGSKNQTADQWNTRIKL